jgi:hypothetical protein
MFFIGTCDVIVSVFLVRIAIKANKAQAQGSPDLPHLLQLYNTFFIVDAILIIRSLNEISRIRLYMFGLFPICLSPLLFLCSSSVRI